MQKTLFIVTLLLLSVFCVAFAYLAHQAYQENPAKKLLEVLTNPSQISLLVGDNSPSSRQTMDMLLTNALLLNVVQASVIKQFFGFMTGMLLAILGGFYVVGRVEGSGAEISAQGPSVLATINSKSPGLIITFLGVALMFFSINHDALIDKTVRVSDTEVTPSVHDKETMKDYPIDTKAHLENLRNSTPVPNRR